MDAVRGGLLDRAQRRIKMHKQWNSNRERWITKHRVRVYTFDVGTAVYKPKGYTYEGWVIARFVTMAGEERYVVENAQSLGMLHIFNAGQLEEL